MSYIPCAYCNCSAPNSNADCESPDFIEDNYEDIPELTKLPTSQVTCVTGLWNTGETYDKCLNNTLLINCPYVFFGDHKSIEYVKNIRGDDYPTYYIEYNIEDFDTYKYIDKTIIDELYCHSLELNLIWNEKINMIKIAAEYNIYDSEFFCWIDADINIYKNCSPSKEVFPNKLKINRLPKDKFIYSSTGNEFDEDKVYYIWNYHYISGISYIIHKNIINDFAKLYGEYMEDLIDINNLWTDKVILTRIYNDNKELFYKLSDNDIYDMCIVPLLY